MPKPRTTPQGTPNGPGVYALYSGDLCLYVGAASSLDRRLASHPLHGKFDRVEWEECPEIELIERENQMIEKLQPTFNQRRSSGNQKWGKEKACAKTIDQKRAEVRRSLADRRAKLMKQGTCRDCGLNPSALARTDTRKRRPTLCEECRTKRRDQARRRRAL